MCRVVENCFDVDGGGHDGGAPSLYTEVKTKKWGGGGGGEGCGWGGRYPANTHKLKKKNGGGGGGDMHPACIKV